MIVVGRQNKIALRIFEGGERRGDLSDVTRWTVWVGTLKIESVLNPSAFDWTGHRDDGGDLLVLELGGLDLPAGPTTLRACYYTEETPFGVEVENALPMGVRRATSGGLAVPPTLEGVIFDDLLEQGIPAEALERVESVLGAYATVRRVWEDLDLGPSPY